MKDEQKIDRLLSSESQSQMGQLIRDLPEDSLSMVWRSNLNERLLVESAKVNRRRRVLWYLKPSVGLVAMSACILGVFFFKINRDPVAPSTAIQSKGLEAKLVSLHRDASTSIDITGIGLSSLEAENDSSKSVDPTMDWTESDLEGL